MMIIKEVFMKELGIANQLCHKGITFKRLQELLSEGIGYTYNQEKWCIC